MQRIDRRHREVTALDGRAMADVAVLVDRSEFQSASSESILQKQPLMSEPQRTSSKTKNSGSGTKVGGVGDPVDFR